MALPVAGPRPVPPGLLRRRISPLAVISMCVLGLGTLLLALAVFMAGGPVGAVITTVLAAFSFPLLILLCFWLDRYEPEPARYRVAALAWGATIAVLIGGGLAEVAAVVTGSSQAISTVVWAPIFEEFGKGLFLVVIVLLRRRQLHGLLDGIVYTALAGIGFAFAEDVLYYLSAWSEGGLNSLAPTFILRGLIGPFAHPLFTSAIGLGVGIALMARSAFVRFLAPALGYLVAVALHATWNGSATWGGLEGWLMAYAVVMLPAFLLLVIVGVWARRREGRLLGSALADCVRLGLLPPEDVRWVAQLSDRMAARKFAKRQAGPAGVRVLREYQQTLTEIAFLHHRVREGSGPPDAIRRMHALLERAAALRPYVILPPGPAWPRPQLG